MLLYAVEREICADIGGALLADVQDGLFGDLCELNFTTGVSEPVPRDLARDYYAMQEVEEAATESLSKTLPGQELRQATVFIPSLIVEFDRFWRIAD